jgi:pyruvate/2-oxoglutarate dehydrogenase complex dihydrolipoamide dehydrogenase (E3) component
MHRCRAWCGARAFYLRDERRRSQPAIQEAIWIESLPASVVIVGGSIISCEFASLWAAFGVEVTIVARGLMPQEDPRSAPPYSRHLRLVASASSAAESWGWRAWRGAGRSGWRARPVYAIPETASIGLLESEARAQGLEVDVARVSYQDIARAVIQGETEGFAKIIAERSSGQILGAAIVGAQACELIGEIAVAMAGRVSAWLVGDTQHPYPTLSELVRWTADQVGKASRSAAEQALGVPVAVPAMLSALDHRRGIHRPRPSLAVR